MIEKLWWVVPLVVFSLFEEILKARRKARKKKANVARVENAEQEEAQEKEGIVDWMVQAVIEKQKGSSAKVEPVRGGVAEVGESQDFLGERGRTDSVGELSLRGESDVVGAEMVGTARELDRVEPSYSMESYLGMPGEGISYMGYEAGGGIITEISESLDTMPTVEGGEGLAAQKAKEIRVKEETRMRELTREQPVSLGSKVLANPRMAMLATFIFEPKFKRRGY